MISRDDFRLAMQRMAAPVTLITSRAKDGSPVGLVASAVTSLSAEPPSLLVCINQTAGAHDAILESGRIGISLVPDGDSAVADAFARAKGAARFEHGNWVDGETGIPVYAGAPVSFECAIARTADGYSHSIVICDIVKVHFAAEDHGCLMWHRQSFGRTSRLDT